MKNNMSMDMDDDRICKICNYCTSTSTSPSQVSGIV